MSEKRNPLWAFVRLILSAIGILIGLFAIFAGGVLGAPSVIFGIALCLFPAYQAFKVRYSG